MSQKPLTESDYKQLQEMLDRFTADGSMNLESMDGFFVALLCCPSAVPPDEYMPELWGGEVLEELFASRHEWLRFLDLVIRHWNNAAQILYSGEMFLPMLLKAEGESPLGIDWATGFMRGVALRRNDWSELFDSRAGLIVLKPILTLAQADGHEWPQAERLIDANQRKELLIGVVAAVAEIYRYFTPHRQESSRQARPPAEHAHSAVLH